MSKKFKLVETFSLVKSKNGNCEGCFFDDNPEIDNSNISIESGDPCRFCKTNFIFEKFIELKEIK